MRDHRRALRVACLLLVAGACDRGEPASEPSTSGGSDTATDDRPTERTGEAARPTPGGGAATSPAGDEAPGGVDALRGPLDESSFAALHEHRGDAAPDPAGETVELADGSSAYLALPVGDAPHPGVIVVHEWWGLNDHIRHWADRLAADGYAALAVDLYRGRVASEPGDAIKLVQGVDEDRAIRTLEAAHAFLQQDDRTRAPHTASIGWCFGGGWSLRAGLALDGLDATVVYYGQPITEVDRLRALDGPLLGIFGTEDGSIPLERVAAFDEALDDAGVPHEVHRYEAEHAFANPSSGRYDAAAAARAWQRVRAFLDAHLTPDG